MPNCGKPAKTAAAIYCSIKCSTEFRFKDRDFSELQSAGFGKIEFSVLPRESRAPSARDVALAFVAGSPLAGQLAEQGVEKDALEAVETALVEEFGRSEVRAPMQSIAITAGLPRAA